MKIDDLPAKEGDLRVWWQPQVLITSYYAYVYNIEQAVFALKLLAEYDLFQLENKVKSDYANVGGLEVYSNGEWIDWVDDNGNDIDDFMKGAII